MVTYGAARSQACNFSVCRRLMLAALVLCMSIANGIAPAFAQQPPNSTARTARAAPSPPNQWWNKDWDQRTIYVPRMDAGGYNSYAAAASTKNREITYDLTPFIFFLLANSPGLGVQASGPWLFASFFQNCERARPIMRDFTTTAGDRQRAMAALAATRAEYLQWAAGQPRTLTMYLPVTLGRWDAGTGEFLSPVAATAHTSRAFAVNPPSAFVHETISVTGYSGTSTGDLRLSSIGSPNTEQSAVCPGDGAGLSYAYYALAWSVRFYRAPMTNRVSFQGEYNTDPLPPLKMTAQQAQAFAAANPSRRVIYEITISVDPQISLLNAGTSLLKRAVLQGAKVTDLRGNVLAERAY